MPSGHTRTSVRSSARPVSERQAFFNLTRWSHATRLLVATALCDGPVDPSGWDAIMERIVAGGFGHQDVSVLSGCCPAVAVLSASRVRLKGADLMHGVVPCVS